MMDSIQAICPGKILPLMGIPTIFFTFWFALHLEVLHTEEQHVQYV